MLAKWCEIRNDPCRHEERERGRERRRKRVTQMEKTEQKKNEMLGSFILTVQKSPKCTIMLLLSSPSTRYHSFLGAVQTFPKLVQWLTMQFQFYTRRRLNADEQHLHRWKMRTLLFLLVNFKYRFHVFLLKVKGK